MLREQTLERMRTLGLGGMLAAFQLQEEQPDLAELSFVERLGLLVDAEWTHRRDRTQARLLKEAKLRLPACFEDLSLQAERGLDRQMVRRLSTCQFVREHENVLITGATGVGKTFLACALGNACCRQGLRARYFRMARLLGELALARGDGSYPSFMSRLAKTDLLILDDFGLSPLAPAEARDLLEVIDDRTQTRSTVIAAQLPLDAWHGAITDPTLADAILDRLIHNAHTLDLKGESQRKTRQTMKSPPVTKES